MRKRKTITKRELSIRRDYSIIVNSFKTGFNKDVPMTRKNILRAFKWADGSYALDRIILDFNL